MQKLECMKYPIAVCIQYYVGSAAFLESLHFLVQDTDTFFGEKA